MTDVSTYRQLNDLLLRLRSTFQVLGDWGWTGADCSPRSLGLVREWDRVPGPCHQCESLEEIRLDLGDCRRCALAAGRNKLVFGQGNPKADLVFVGEAPGAEEDRSGLPFVGEAGQLLTRIIQAMKLDRQEVYICNVIKCRPPGNRDPLPEEIDTCRPFLERQLAVIQPRVICTLGAHATRTLLNTKGGIFSLRGRFHDFNGIKVMPTFHPAYLLRNPDQKRLVWEDIQKIMAELKISR